jgi:ribose transport system ATP-binding protein
LDNVDLDVGSGSIHAILGENGAGKSTLMKSLVGVVRPDTGLIEIMGREADLSDPQAAARLGVVCVFQELSLVPHLTVAENICLAEPPLTCLGFISKRESRRVARDLLAQMGVEGIDPDSRCKDLPLTKQQLVEIAKALHQKPRLLILDEATSALSADDVARLFALLRELRDEGVSSLFISHRMHEIDEIADTCSVFRNGARIETFAVGTRSDAERVQMMIGRPIQQVYPPKPARLPQAGTPRLETRGLGWEDTLHDISLSVMPGEICGLGGLEGQGQNSFLLALFGVLRGLRGSILFDGTEIDTRSPRQARGRGGRFGLIPESRKTEGLFLDASVGDNLTVAALETLSRHGFIQERRRQSLATDLISRFQIKTPSVETPVRALSGGNQQKVLLSKWIALSPRLLLLNDPTRGVDVGTKQQIYNSLRELAREGMSLIVYSTDYDELMGLCDKVHVFYGGRDVALLEGGGLTEQALISAAMGKSHHATSGAMRRVS